MQQLCHVCVLLFVCAIQSLTPLFLITPLRSYHTAFAYLFTVFLCIAYRRNLFHALIGRIQRLKRQHYSDIPEAGGLPIFHQEAYANKHNKGVELWKRLMINIKNMTQKFGKPAREKGRRE